MEERREEGGEWKRDGGGQRSRVKRAGTGGKREEEGEWVEKKGG